MSTYLEELRAFFGRLEDDAEGSKVFGYLDHDFELKVSGAGNFVLKREGSGFSIDSGELGDPDFRQVTVVETDEKTFRDVMTGRVRPSAALYSTDLIMDSMMSNLAYNHCFLRLLRRGAELNR